MTALVLAPNSSTSRLMILLTLAICAGGVVVTSVASMGQYDELTRHLSTEAFRLDATPVHGGTGRLGHASATGLRKLDEPSGVHREPCLAVAGGNLLDSREEGTDGAALVPF